MSIPNFELRNSVENELGTLFALHEQLFRIEIEELWGWDEKWQRDNFISEWKEQTMKSVIIDHNVIGYIQYRSSSKEFYLSNIALDPLFQNRGIGRALMETLRDDAAKMGHPLVLSVFYKNTVALNFYRKLGFKRTGGTEHHQRLMWSLPTSEPIKHSE